MEDMTAEDHKSVDHASRVLYEQGWRKRFSINEMTSAWRGLIREVEDGYDQVVDEYTNDLSCRDWLALAWPMLTERVRVARLPELEALDARFLAATVEDADGRLGRVFNVEGKDWWWQRIPAIRRGEFAADLDS